MASKMNTLYKAAKDISVKNKRFDYSINRPQSYIGTAEDLATILGCTKHSIQNHASNGKRLKSYTITPWQRYSELYAYGIRNRKGKKLNEIKGHKMYPISIFSTVLGYTPTYIARASTRDDVGRKDIWKDKQIVRIDKVIIRHYTYKNGEPCDIYVIDNGKELKEEHYS
jgi:hypothetical protein